MCPFLTSMKGLGYGQKPDPLKIQAHYCSLVHSLITSRPCCKGSITRGIPNCYWVSCPIGAASGKVNQPG